MNLKGLIKILINSRLTFTKSISIA